MKRSTAFIFISLSAFWLCGALSSCQNERSAEQSEISEPGLDPGGTIPSTNPGPVIDQDPSVNDKPAETGGNGEKGRGSSTTTSRGGGGTTTTTSPPVAPPVEALPRGPSQADANQLRNRVALSGNLAYLDEESSFRINLDDAQFSEWRWTYNVGEGERSLGSRDIRHNFRSLGTKEIRLRARASNGVEFETTHNVLVTVSKQRLNSIISGLVTMAKTAEAANNWRPVDDELGRLKNYLASNVSFSIPGESGGQSFGDFRDILIADIPYEDRFSGVSEYKYDPSTGLVTYIKLIR
jgi:hypothetical protein